LEGLCSYPPVHNPSNLSLHARSVHFLNRDAIHFIGDYIDIANSI
jgi:hypothetical protein